MKPDQVARKVALWAGAFLAVATALGLINKVFIVEPILVAVADERAARIHADSNITAKLAEIAERQAMFVAAAITAPGSPEHRRAEIYLRENAWRKP